MLKVVRADDGFGRLPIIVLTTDETKKAEVLNHGANSFLTKPICNEDLLRQISDMIV